jgi:hypothetical protein
MAAGQALLDAIEPLYSGNLSPYGLASRLGIEIAYEGSSEFRQRSVFRKIRDYKSDRCIERFRTEWGSAPGVIVRIRINERHACVTDDQLTHRFGNRLQWTSSSLRHYPEGTLPPPGIRPTHDVLSMIGENGARISFGFDYVGVSEVTVALDHLEGFDPGDDPQIADFEIVQAGEPYHNALKRLAALGCDTSNIGSIEVMNSGKPFRLAIRPTNLQSPRSRVEYVSVCRSVPAEAHNH